ncbi:DNA adenine methylase [Patescibacteria group bacterium]
MQTLIKWPGGKSKEFQYIKDMIPSFDRYVEPFFGGGAVFFQLKPKKAIINDYAEDLVSLYSLIKDEKKQKEFQKELFEYVSNWEKIPKYISIFENKFIKLYERYKNEQIDKTELSKLTSEILKKEEKKFITTNYKKFGFKNKKNK